MIKQFYLLQFNLAQVKKIKWFQVLLCITNNSIKHQSFVYTQLNDQTLLFLSHLFALSLNVRQFYLTDRLDSIRYPHSGPECTWERWQWRVTTHSTKLHHYWSLIIRLFNEISGTFIGGPYSSAKLQSVYSTAPTEQAKTIIDPMVGYVLRHINHREFILMPNPVYIYIYI